MLQQYQVSITFSISVQSVLDCDLKIKQNMGMFSSSTISYRQITSSVSLCIICFCAPGLLDPHTTPEKLTPLPNMCGTVNVNVNGNPLDRSTRSPSAHTFAPGEVSRDESGSIWVESNESSSAASQGGLWFQSHCRQRSPSMKTGRTGFWCLQFSFLRAQTSALE